jgi:hypothetical protein
VVRNVGKEGFCPNLKIPEMFKILKKILNSKPKKPISKMSNYNDFSLEELHEKFSEFDFTWLKGDNAGDTERYSRMAGTPDLKFVVFQSGNRINIDLLDEYMTTFPKSHVALDLNPVHSAPAVIPIQPVQPAQTSVQSISYAESTQVNSDSPIFKLLEKQKKNMIDVNIKLKINLPSKDLYNVLIESFEGAEDEVIEYIINGIQIEEIKKSLSESIKKNYYHKAETTKQPATLKSKKSELETQ